MFATHACTQYAVACGLLAVRCLLVQLDDTKRMATKQALLRDVSCLWLKACPDRNTNAQHKHIK